MLAQSFKSAAELQISEAEQDALIKVLGMLERGEIDAEHFNMDSYLNECGTVGCIAGWAYLVSNEAAFPEVSRDCPKSPARGQHALMKLFRCGLGDLFARPSRKTSPDQAAIALRSYLTTGEANWAEALAEASAAKGR